MTNISTTGSVRVEGKIEVCANFVFHTLCDYYWNPVDAQVFCRYLSKFYAPPSADISKEFSIA